MEPFTLFENPVTLVAVEERSCVPLEYRRKGIELMWFKRLGRVLQHEGSGILQAQISTSSQSAWKMVRFQSFEGF